jgi:TonB family protein
MRKNSVFRGMIGLSAALHGLALLGVPGDGTRSPPPAEKYQFVQTVKMIKIGIRPPTNVPDRPREKKIIEKIVEPAPEVPLFEEIEEETEDTGEPAPQDNEGTEAGEGGHDEEAREGGEGRATEEVPESETMTDREYDALLAYIKVFIDKNLVYPAMARRRNVEGIVGVHFEIQRNGILTAVTVDHSSGSSILDNAAVSLVKKIRPPENLTLDRTLALRVNIEYELTE